MAPEQLLFFAIFLLLAVFNLFARWIRSRMGRPPAPPGEQGGPPREDPAYEIREIPPPREMPPPREVPPPREAPRPRDVPPLREMPRPREAPPVRATPSPREVPPLREAPRPRDLRERREPGPLPPRVRVRAPVSLEDMGTIAPAPPPSTTIAVRRRRSRLRLGDRSELRRAILLRTILGPPRALDRPEREVQ